MRTILYLVGKDPTPLSQSLFKTDSQDTSVILIQEAVSSVQVPISRVSALSEDVSSRNAMSSLPTLSYQDVLRSIFEADAVIAL